MRIAILLGLGLCNGGGQTLAFEWSTTLTKCKIEHKVFYYNGKAYGSKESPERTTENFEEFSNFLEVGEKIDEYDTCFVFSTPLWNDKNHTSFVEMFTNLETKKVVGLIDRNRNPLKLKRWSTDIIKAADLVLHISGEEHSGFKVVKDCNPYTIHADLNLYNWKGYESIPFEDKKKYRKISFVGRFVSLKGYKKIIKDYHKLPKKFSYTIEGGFYKYTDGITKSLSTTIGILSDICRDNKTKEPKDGIVIHGNYDSYYEDIRTRGVLHLYPKYDWSAMVERTSNSLFNLYPYCNHPGMFRGAIEYTVLESIDCGVPLILSNDYGSDCHVNGIPLNQQDCGIIFYDDFSEIEDKVNAYCKNYDDNVHKMRLWFESNYSAKSKLKNILTILKSY